VKTGLHSILNLRLSDLDIEFEIRPAEKPDVAHLEILINASAFQTNGDGQLLPLSKKEIETLVNQGAFYCAWDGINLIGCVSIVEYSGLVELRSLIVSRSHRSHGVGQSLIHTAMKAAKSKGYKELLALTNASAIPLFEATGFRKEPRPPEKLARDCARCPLLHEGCIEEAVVANL